MLQLINKDKIFNKVLFFKKVKKNINVNVEKHYIEFFL